MTATERNQGQGPEEGVLDVSPAVTGSQLFQEPLAMAHLGWLRCWMWVSEDPRLAYFAVRTYQVRPQGMAS